MILTKKPATRLEIRIPALPKDVTHSHKVKVLGIDIDERLGWKYFLMDSPNSITNQLRTRVNSLKILSKSANQQQLKMVASGIVMSKFEYGAEVWAAAPSYIIKVLQSIQLEAARTILGPKTKRWSTTSLLKQLTWLSIDPTSHTGLSKTIAQNLYTPASQQH